MKILLSVFLFSAVLSAQSLPGGVNIDPTGGVAAPGSVAVGVGSNSTGAIDFHAQTSNNTVTLAVDPASSPATVLLPGLSGIVPVISGPVTIGNCVIWTSAFSIGSGGAPPCGSGTSTGGSGSFTIGEQHTVSAAQSIDFTSCLTPGSDTYQIRLVGIVPGTSGDNLYMRFSSNGGTSYDAGNNYDVANLAWIARATGLSGGISATQLTIAGQGTTVEGVGTAPGSTVSGTFDLTIPSGLYSRLTGTSNYYGSVNAQMEGLTVMGTWKSTTSPNAFRIFFSSGTITGTARCYAVSH